MSTIIVEDGPHPVDLHVGSRLADLRKRRGFNQSQLGAALNLTFQQIQKYEKGTNRISASKLWQASEFFGVDVNYFYNGFAHGDGPQTGLNETVVNSPITPQGRSIASLVGKLTLPQQKLALELIRAMARNVDAED